MKWIKLYEDFQLGDLIVVSPEKIQDLFSEECKKEIPNLESITELAKLKNTLNSLTIELFKEFHYSNIHQLDALF